MPLMEQQVTVKRTWLQIDGNQGTTFVDAADVTDSGLQVGESTDDEELLARYSDYYEGTQIYTVGLVKGYGARLSAPGYLDCTEWSVFASAKEAQEYLDENYSDGDGEVDDEDE